MADNGREVARRLAQAMTSLTAFYNGLHGLAVTGVSRRYAHPPKDVNDADMPALWVESIGKGSEREFTGTDRDGEGGLTATVVIVTTAIVLGAPAENMTETLTIADALHDALENADIAIGALNYEITTTVRSIGGDRQYHAIEATVSAIG